MIHRCVWSVKTENEQKYHDTEWGIPVYDDRLLFEMLTLEGAQAGLSWSTILNKREGYRKAFDNFDWDIIINYDEVKIEALRNDVSIVRNKLKINSVVTNAKALKDVIAEFGSFSNYIWGFTDAKAIQNKWIDVTEVPAKTALSDKISKDLKKRGFKFIGSTICYAFMQAIGMVNDHTVDCFRYKQVQN